MKRKKSLSVIERNESILAQFKRSQGRSPPLGLPPVLGLSFLPAAYHGQQEAHLPVDERTGSFSDQDKPI